MQITKNFKRDGIGGFFWFNRPELAICIGFVKNFIEISRKNQTIEVTISNENPDDEDFREVFIVDDFDVKLDKEKYLLCSDERKFLYGIGCVAGSSFWIKIVEIEG